MILEKVAPLPFFPMTGEAPDDPRTGFLPPNNGTTGQGYVTFTARLKKNLPPLTRIDAKASIYFDKNEPIDTPPIFNTVSGLYILLSSKCICWKTSFEHVLYHVRSGKQRWLQLNCSTGFLEHKYRWMFVTRWIPVLWFVCNLWSVPVW